jgi:hypothetical protein
MKVYNMSIIEEIRNNLTQQPAAIFNLAYNMRKGSNLVSRPYVKTMDKLFDSKFEETDISVFKKFYHHSLKPWSGYSIDNIFMHTFLYIPAYNITLPILPNITKDDVYIEDCNHPYMYGYNIPKLKNKIHRNLNRYWFVSLCSMLMYNEYYKSPVYMVREHMGYDYIRCSTNIIKKLFEHTKNLKNSYIMFYVISVLMIRVLILLPHNIKIFLNKRMSDCCVYGNEYDIITMLFKYLDVSYHEVMNTYVELLRIEETLFTSLRTGKQTIEGLVI